MKRKKRPISVELNEVLHGSSIKIGFIFLEGFAKAYLLKGSSEILTFPNSSLTTLHEILMRVNGKDLMEFKLYC
ncbi:MAG: hypothetical protein ACI923_001305 [Flavobacteriales bacterium]|jgi:hypothetical protein